MRSTRHTSVVVALTAALVAIGPLAAAQVPPSDKAAAESFFREGRTLMNAGKTSEACGKFAESQRLDPQLGTELNLALCHEKEGKTASAWAEFDEVAEQATRPADKQRSDFARQHAKDLEKKLSRVRISVAAAAADTTVKVDGRAIGSSAWGAAFPVDPGDHTVEASAPNKKTWSQGFKAAPGPASVDVVVPALGDADAAPPTVPAPPVTTPVPATTGATTTEQLPPPPPDTNPAPSTGSGRRTLGFVLGGVGIVGVGLGTYFGLRTLSKNSTANDNCPNDRCNAVGVQAGSDASSAATISTIGFGVGIVGLAAGAYFILTAKPSAPKPAGLQVAPMVGSTGSGVQLAGQW